MIWRRLDKSQIDRLAGNTGRGRVVYRDAVRDAVERVVADHDGHDPIGRILASGFGVDVLDALENRLVVRQAGGARDRQRHGISAMGDIGSEGHREMVGSGECSGLWSQR